MFDCTHSDALVEFDPNQDFQTNDASGMEWNIFSRNLGAKRPKRTRKEFEEIKLKIGREEGNIINENVH